MAGICRPTKVFCPMQRKEIAKLREQTHDGRSYLLRSCPTVGCDPIYSEARAVDNWCRAAADTTRICRHPAPSRREALTSNFSRRLKGFGLAFDAQAFDLEDSVDRHDDGIASFSRMISSKIGLPSALPTCLSMLLACCCESLGMQSRPVDEEKCGAKRHVALVWVFGLLKPLLWQGRNGRCRGYGILAPIEHASVGVALWLKEKQWSSPAGAVAWGAPSRWQWRSMARASWSTTSALPLTAQVATRGLRNRWSLRFGRWAGTRFPTPTMWLTLPARRGSSGARSTALAASTRW